VDEQQVAPGDLPEMLVRGPFDHIVIISEIVEEATIGRRWSTSLRVISSR
jgi:hypothetical protein